MMRTVEFDDIETPIGYLDLDRVRANARRIAGYAAEHGFTWRPHVKTHKSIAIARMQLDAGACGLSVATLREAEAMATLTDDLLLAYPPVGRPKLDRLVGLPARIDMKVALDALPVLTALSERAAAAGRTVGVLVEVDMGLGRVGVQTPEAAVSLAREADRLPGVAYRGVLFYPGHIRVPSSEQAQPMAGLADRLAKILNALKEAGLPPEIVSGGSTPTVWNSHMVPGLTEIRAGSGVFFDKEALEIGVASLDDVAYTVLATVVSTSVPGRAVVDAGSKSMTKEARGAANFGFLLDHPEVTLAGLSEEHGVLDVSRSSWVPAIGDRVRIVPNHVCVSVNLQDALLAKDGAIHTLLALEARGRTPWTG